MSLLREDKPRSTDLIVMRARLRGHVCMAVQQEGSFCIVSMWDHDEQLSGRVLVSNKSDPPTHTGYQLSPGGPRVCIWGYQSYIFGTTYTYLVLDFRMYPITKSCVRRGKMNRGPVIRHDSGCF